MTVNVNDTIERYVVSGVGPYPFSFRIFADTDLQVNACSTATPPVPQPLTYLTHYTVTGANVQSGGSITLTASAAATYAGYALDIRTNTPQTQPTSIRNIGRFLPEIHEDAFDNLERQTQDLNRRLLASIHLPDNEILSGEVEPAAVRKGKYLFWDSVTGAISSALSLTGTVLSQAIFNTFYFLTDDKKRTPAEIAAGVVPVNYAYAPGNVRRYGAVVDGVTEDAAAIRKAWDLCALDGTVVTCEPPGPIKVSSTVYIPQPSSGTHREMRAKFHGCTFIGQGRGTGTIFESGTGALSTGGATNFGQPNESATSLHYATIIEGGLYTACGAAFRLFNFIYGCELLDIRFEDVSLPLYALRCFASRYYSLDAQVSTITGGTYLFQFDGVNNAIIVQGCSAAGNAGGTTGIGFGFTGQGAGIVFTGNTMENIDIGLYLGAIQGMVNKGNYYEQINTRAIDASSASNREMDIDDNWFLNCTQVISAQLWIAGKLGAANHIQGAGGAVVINDNFSFCTVEIPPVAFSETTSLASSVLVPTNYTLSGTVQLVARRFVFAAAGGFGTRLAVDMGDNKVTPPFAYSGGPASDGAGYWLPFATQTNSLASSTIDTQIRWATYMMECVFDLYGDIGGGGNIRLYGFVFGNNTVFRCDGSSATWTVTASNNAGLLRLTIGGAGLAGKTMTGWLGTVRHM